MALCYIYLGLSRVQEWNEEVLLCILSVGHIHLVEEIVSVYLNELKHKRECVVKDQLMNGLLSKLTDAMDENNLAPT